MKSKYIISLCVLFTLSFSCKKDVFNFPYVPINLNLGINSDLGQLGPGGVIYKNGYGVRGLIIYRDYSNNYFVYDRACTHEKDFSCSVDTTSFTQRVECPCCKSQFLILGESSDPIKGPATYPLYQYNSFIEGDLLKIVN